MFGFGRGGMGSPAFDELGKTLAVGGAGALLFSKAFAYGTAARVVLSLGGTAALVCFALRMLSKDPARTAGQNTRFLALLTGVKEFFRDPKGHFRKGKTTRTEKAAHTAHAEPAGEPVSYKYIACPNCAKSLRVPRGKGHIRVTCPQCGERFETEC
ncbi:MAG: hypothetical protein Q4C53_05720 [Clostridia bacterium]|nr:hypothetical protein [Clostridia bacterium]